MTDHQYVQVKRRVDKALTDDCRVINIDHIITVDKLGSFGQTRGLCASEGCQ